jgi:hypothetical protein
MEKESIMRFGIATKGFVFVLLGGLTVVAAFGLRVGGDSDSNGVLDYLSRSTIGTLILAITAAGLVAYVFWRFYQAFADSEHKGNGKKGLAKRVGYFSSGLIYALLAFTALQILFGNGGDSGGGSNSYLAQALSHRYGQIIVGIIAIGYLGKAMYQIHRAYTGNYRKKIREQHLDDNSRKLLVVSGIAGYTARGVVIGIIAYMFFRAAWTSNSNEAGGTSEAFYFLQNEFGAIALVVIALGLVMYGIFYFLTAKHRQLNVD